MASNKKTQESSDIIQMVFSYVQTFFNEQIGNELTFHDINHTLNVVKFAGKLCEKEKVSSSDTELVTIAAYFHDTGYAFKRENHEEESVKLARDFLMEKKYSESKVEIISELILSTKRTQKPQNHLEKILHDADLSHIGKKSFFDYGELLRAELEHCNDKKFSELEWENSQYEFLTKEKFLTDYAFKKYDQRRRNNIIKQRSNVKSARKITTRNKTGKDFGRGIDTLYRSIYRNHINFSTIADGKANMMISINTILISVIITFSGASLSIFKELEFTSLRFTIPILVLLISSLISVVFAVISARPKVTKNEVDKEAVKKKEVSLLFFGNFLGVNRDEFKSHLEILKNNQKDLYDSMSIDVYNLGVVLKEKYRLISLSYTVFMIGLLASVVGFMLIFLYTKF